MKLTLFKRQLTITVLLTLGFVVLGLLAAFLAAQLTARNLVLARQSSTPI